MRIHISVVNLSKPHDPIILINWPDTQALVLPDVGDKLRRSNGPVGTVTQRLFNYGDQDMVVELHTQIDPS